MAFHSLRCGGYLLLAVAGWAAGRWVWPGEHGKVAGSGAAAVRLSAGTGHRVLPAKTAGVKPVDGKAAGREMRASGSEAGFRDRARQMALEPPPALTDFLAAGLREDYPVEAAIWAGTLIDSSVKISELKQVLDATSGPALAGLREAVNRLDLTPEERTKLNLNTQP